MTTFNTGNPIGSTNVKDLYDNAENFDVAANSRTSRSWIDRLGAPRKTWWGMEQDFQDFLLSSGYVDIGDYGPGLTITARNQIFARNGELYRAGPGLALPYTTTGDWGAEGSNFVAVGDAALRQDLSGGSGDTLVGRGAGTVADALDGLEASDAGSIFRFGGVGDGTTDVSPAIALAVQTQGRVVFPWTELGYSVQGNPNIILSRDIELDFNGSVVDFGDAARLRFQSPIVADGLTLDESVLSGGAFIKLNDHTGIQAGDILYISTSQAPSSEWADTKKDCIRIKGFATGYIWLEEALNFSYGPSDPDLSVTIYRPHSVTLRNGHFLLGDDTNPRVMVEITGCQDVILDRLTIEGKNPIDVASSITRVGIMLYKCVGVQVLSPTFIRMSYPVEADGGTRNVRATNVLARDCHHTVEAADWASNVTVDGLDASACYSAISAHPSFNVHFANFSCLQEVGLANVRTLGGSLRNGTIGTRADDTAELPQFQSIILNPDFTYLQSMVDFDVDNVTWIAPGRVTKPVLDVRYGRNVTISNVTAPLVSMSTAVPNSIQNLVYGPGNSFTANNLPSPAQYLSRNPSIVVGSGLVRPYEVSGRYHIDPVRSISDSALGYLKIFGPVSMRNNASPASIPMRIHLNAFPEVTQATKIIGILKLTGTVSHNAGGRFATLFRVFNFICERQSPSLSAFINTPILSSVASGQENENLTMSITSIVFGADDLGVYLDATCVLDAPGLGGYSLSLAYELELIRSL